jgi:hypothetical protein
VEDEDPDPLEDAVGAGEDGSGIDVTEDCDVGSVDGGGTLSTGGADNGPVGPFGNSLVVSPAATAAAPRWA